MVFSADEAESRAAKGEAVILVRIETSPEDIHGMHAARGILTTRGGMTSHAAVVARGMGRPCVAGAGGISVDYGAQTLSAGGKTVHAGETITLDGATGEVFVGTVAMIEPAMSGDFGTLMEWADACRRLGVRANAETPLDAETARKFGAEGIGLCRTEHMFFDPERIGAVRQMIMAQRRARPPRRAGAAAAVPARGFPSSCSASWAGCRSRSACSTRRCTSSCRTRDAELEEVAQALGTDVEGDAPPRRANWPRPTRCSAIAAAGSASPIPEIYEMQARAIFEGALAVAKETGKAPVPEIMIPLVGTKQGAGDHPRPGREGGARRCSPRPGRTIEYSVGTMIELPRAALHRGQDRRGRRLLQLRHQRPDADRVRPVARRCRQVPAAVCRAGHPAEGPVRLDRRRGRGRDAAQPRRGREAREPLKLGICGEHGGDPASIAFCEAGRAGLRLVQPVPRAGGAAGGGAGGFGDVGRPHGESTGRR